MSVQASHPRIALVIGAGGLRCVSAFGALAVLRREGIEIDRLVACSGGAAVAYWIATGGRDIADGIARYTVGMQRSFNALSWRHMIGAVLPRWLPAWLSPGVRFGLMQDAAFNRYMAAELNGIRFEDLAIPTHFVAADVHSGEQVVISEGPVLDGLRASLALPLLLPPWPVKGRLLTDGGVCNPLPVDVAMREGADIILAMGFEDPLEPQLGSGLALARQVMSIAGNHLLRAQFAFHSLSHHAEVLPLMPDFGQKVGLRDLHLIPELVREGERATEREMPYLRKLLQGAASARKPAGW